MFKRIAEMVLASRWPLALGLTLVTLWFGEAALRIQIDPSTESLFAKQSEDYRRYREFSEQFGSDHMIALAVETSEIFSEYSLDLLKEITDKISGYHQVERVISLANAMDIRHRFMGVRVEPVLKRVYEGDLKPQEVKLEILGNELYRNNLISADGRIANILIYLNVSGDDRESSGFFVGELKRYLESLKGEAANFYLAGAPMEQYDFIRYIRRDQFIFIPIISILFIITTWLIYRNFACVVLAMSIVFMTLVWTMGTLTLLGQDINLVTSLLAPVMMIIAVVNSIHLINLFFEMRVHHASLNDSITLTMSQLGAPCFLTHFTTVLGFVSLAINPIPAIRCFGFFAAMGTVYSYFLELILTPLLLPILPYRQTQDVESAHFFNRFFVYFLENLELRWKWPIMAAVAGVFVISLVGIQRLEVDTSLIKQMKPDTPLAIATRFIDDRLTGVYVLGFVIRKKDGSAIVDYESLQKLDTFKEFLEGQSEIVKVNAITAVIKKINQAREDSPEGYRIPADRDRLNSYFEGMRSSEDPELWKLATPDFRQLRFEARMKAVGTKEGALMEERVLQYMDQTLAKDFEYHLTGNIVLLGRMAKGLVHYQMSGFGFAFFSILILIVMIFRSLRMGILASVPNILPILGVYGFMGFMRIELSSPTAMISSIVLGMVVDASIHFLHRFRLEFTHRRNYLQSLHHTFRDVGQSLVVSTSILCAGFAASIFASFRPTILLGVLTSITIFAALVCTLVVLPVCLVILKPFGPERLFGRSHIPVTQAPRERSIDRYPPSEGLKFSSERVYPDQPEGS